MRADLKDKKGKIRAVALRLAEQMKRHLVMYEERHRAMDAELKQVTQSLDAKQRSAQAQLAHGLEEMDRDVQDGFAKVADCVEGLEREVGDKNRLFERKMREAMKSVNEVLGKEGRAWRTQIREISLINEMHQHVILESFQSSNGHIDNLERCLADLSQELASNFQAVQDKLVRIRAEANTAGLIAKIQTNLRFEGITDSLDKLRAARNRDQKKLLQRIDRERAAAMAQIGPVKMHVNKLGADLVDCAKKLGTVQSELEKGTGGLRQEIRGLVGEMEQMTTRNKELHQEVEAHVQSQQKLLAEYKVGIDQNREEVLREFADKVEALDAVEQRRADLTRRLVGEESLRLKENILAQNHSAWEKLVAHDAERNEDFLLGLMKQNHDNFFSFLVGPEDVYKVPRNDLEGAKKEWRSNQRVNGRVHEQPGEPLARSSAEDSAESKARDSVQDGGEEGNLA